MAGRIHSGIIIIMGRGVVRVGKNHDFFEKIDLID